MSNIINILDLYNDKIVIIKDWIFNLLNSHHQNRVSIDQKSFGLIPSYFSNKILKNSFAIYTDKVPILPFHEMGLEIYSEMEKKEFVGMTYLNCFFISNSEQENESLHFHELIHVLQWNYLGIEKFLFCYALGLGEFGYRNSPLEVMAYKHQDMFEKGEVYNVENIVIQEMKYFDELLRKYNIFN